MRPLQREHTMYRVRGHERVWKYSDGRVYKTAPKTWVYTRRAPALARVGDLKRRDGLISYEVADVFWRPSEEPAS